MVDQQVKTTDVGKRVASKIKEVVKKKQTFGDKVQLLDQHVYAGKYKEALALLATMLATLERGDESFGNSVVDTGPQVEKQATIFCAAITRMLSDPECKLDDKQFFAVASLKRPMMQAFEISGYRGTDHLLTSLGTKAENGQVSFTRQEIIKLYMGLSVNALAPNLVEMLLRQPPEVAWPLCIGFLSEQIVYSNHGQAARPRLLAASELLKKAPPVSAFVRNIGPAYMGCSYDESAHKHDIKDAMNAVVRGWIENAGATDIEVPKPWLPVKKRPTVLIMAELYDSKHAMHRCYGPSIEALKPHFRTILMTPSGTMDEALEHMFDEIDPTVFDFKDPAAFIERAKSHKPDIVYFPSIGMRLLSIMASNVRMAPIQVMTFGHPATTRSPHIDYAILDAEQVGSADRLKETILCRASKPRFALREDAKTIKPVLRSNPTVTRIAVPAWSRKVSPVFLQACVKIEQEARKKGRQIEFWFFPNAVGSLFQALSRRVRTMMTARVLPRTNYNAYIEQLNRCDIFLSTFPFGATNGIVDAIKQGIPVVNLTGPEVHEANDSHIVKRFEQPAWLTTKSHGEYIKAVLKLVLKPELRVSIGEALLKNDPDSKLVSKNGADDFATVMRAAYKRHETIQASDKRMWSFEELQSLLEQEPGAKA